MRRVDGKVAVIGVVGLGLAGLGVGLLMLFLWAWESGEHVRAATVAAAQAPQAVGAASVVVTETASIGRFGFPLTTDLSLFLLVVAASGLGAYIHVATSFATYVGNGTFALSWLWWYVLRFLIGIALAVIVYLVLRGGLVNVTTFGSTASQVNPYGVAAVAGLCGLFSKQAVDKVRQVFDTIFQTPPHYGDDERKDKLSALSIESVIPATLTAGTAATLQVRGGGFTQRTILRLNGSRLPTTYVSVTELRARVDAADVAAPGEYRIIASGGPGDADSMPFTVSVVPAGALEAPRTA